MRVIFDTQNIYYLPQYIPIYQELTSRGHECTFVCYKNKNSQQDFEINLTQLGLDYHWVDGESQAHQHYLEDKPDWIVFGNRFNGLDEVHKFSKTAQLGHGVGPKPSYYTKSDTPMTVRFIEGKLRLDKIEKMYPRDNFIQVGFSKLDPIFLGQQAPIDLKQLGLDPNKPTITYAPTFNPSSLECFPDNWPEHFSEYNILIKAHAITFTRAQYKKQRRKLALWNQYSNCSVADQNQVSLLPYLQTADILLSEASSTLFEFIALDKPVVVCDFFKLKWSYRGPFKYRFEKRFNKDNVLYKDIGLHVKAYKYIKSAVEKQLANPQEFANQRKQYRDDHIGPTDGKASVRIADYFEKHLEEMKS